MNKTKKKDFYMTNKNKKFRSMIPRMVNKLREDRNLTYRICAIAFDKTGRSAGRGAYICKNVACLKKAVKAHRLEAAFKVAIPTEVYEALENAMIEE